MYCIVCMSIYSASTTYLVVRVSEVEVIIQRCCVLEESVGRWDKTDRRRAGLRHRSKQRESVRCYFCLFDSEFGLAPGLYCGLAVLPNSRFDLVGVITSSHHVPHNHAV
jgi:hypothetical protein